MQEGECGDGVCGEEGGECVRWGGVEYADAIFIARHSASCVPDHELGGAADGHASGNALSTERPRKAEIAHDASNAARGRRNVYENILGLDVSVNKFLGMQVRQTLCGLA